MQQKKCPKQKEENELERMVRIIYRSFTKYLNWQNLLVLSNTSKNLFANTKSVISERGVLKVDLGEFMKHTRSAVYIYIIFFC